MGKLQTLVSDKKQIKYRVWREFTNDFFESANFNRPRTPERLFFMFRDETDLLNFGERVLIYSDPIIVSTDR